VEGVGRDGKHLVSMAVNTSAVQLKSGDFPAFVRNVLSEMRMPAKDSARRPRDKRTGLRPSNHGVFETLSDGLDAVSRRISS
jgi:hypothetical protein